MSITRLTVAPATVVLWRLVATPDWVSIIPVRIATMGLGVQKLSANVRRRGITSLETRVVTIQRARVRKLVSITRLTAVRRTVVPPRGARMRP